MHENISHSSNVRAEQGGVLWSCNQVFGSNSDVKSAQQNKNDRTATLADANRNCEGTRGRDAVQLNRNEIVLLKI